MTPEERALAELRVVADALASHERNVARLRDERVALFRELRNRGVPLTKIGEAARMTDRGVSITLRRRQA